MSGSEFGLNITLLELKMDISLMNRNFNETLQLAYTHATASTYSAYKQYQYLTAMLQDSYNTCAKNNNRICQEVVSDPSAPHNTDTCAYILICH